FVDGTVQLKRKSAAGKRDEWAVVERGQIGGARLRGEQQSYDRLLAWLSTHLSGGQMAALAADGDRWSPGQAVNFVLGRIVRGGHGRRRWRAGPRRVMAAEGP